MPPPDATVIELLRPPNWRRNAIIRLAVAGALLIFVLGAAQAGGQGVPWWAYALLVIAVVIIGAEPALPAFWELRHPTGHLELRTDELVVHNPAVLRRPLHLPKGDIAEIDPPGATAFTFGRGGLATAERAVMVSVHGGRANTLIRLRRARPVPEVRPLAIPRRHRRSRAFVAQGLWCTVSAEDGQRLVRWLRTRR